MKQETELEGAGWVSREGEEKLQARSGQSSVFKGDSSAFRNHTDLSQETPVLFTNRLLREFMDRRGMVRNECLFPCEFTKHGQFMSPIWSANKKLLGVSQTSRDTSHNLRPLPEVCLGAREIAQQAGHLAWNGLGSSRSTP